MQPLTRRQKPRTVPWTDRPRGGPCRRRWHETRRPIPKVNGVRPGPLVEAGIAAATPRKGDSVSNPGRRPPRRPKLRPDRSLTERLRRRVEHPDDDAHRPTAGVGRVVTASRRESCRSRGYTGPRGALETQLPPLRVAPPKKGVGPLRPALRHRSRRCSANKPYVLPQPGCRTGSEAPRPVVSRSTLYIDTDQVRSIPRCRTAASRSGPAALGYNLSRQIARAGIT